MVCIIGAALCQDCLSGHVIQLQAAAHDTPHQSYCSCIASIKLSMGLCSACLLTCGSQLQLSTFEPAAVLQAMIADVIVTLERSGLPFGATKANPKDLNFYPFRHEAKDYGVFWDTRKGLIPIVGGARETGAHT